MKKKNYTGHYLLISVSASLVVMSSCGLFSPRAENNSLDLVSLSKEKAKRSTKLGEAKELRRKSKSEYKVLLADPAIKQKWGLATTEAQKAWAVHKTLGSRKITVAVIDTGIDINHPDLKNNLWINKAEANGKKGVDDDKNGFVDDIHGWNFVANNNDLKDNHGHGTHIAGIIGAEGGNGIGVSGVAPKVSLMALKYYDPKAPGRNNLMNTVRALKYAVDMNVDIINYSGGGLEQSSAEKKLVAEAQRKGILIVAAAGNEQSNSDIHGYYPADYDFNNIISVTAVDQGKSVLPTSNYGTVSVDIAAPGNNIYSTLPGGNYGYMTGTSQATAFVSGVAVLLKAHYKDFDPDKIIKFIKSTGTPVKSLAGKTKYRNILNIYRAIALKDSGMGRTDVIATNEANLDKSVYSTAKEDEAEFEGRTRVRSVSGLSEISLAIKQKLFQQKAPEIRQDN